MTPEFKNSGVALDDQRALLGITNVPQGKSINATDTKVLKKSQENLIDLLPNIKAFDSDSPTIKTALPERGLFFILIISLFLKVRPIKIRPK